MTTTATQLRLVEAEPTKRAKKAHKRSGGGRDGVYSRDGGLWISYVDFHGERVQRKLKGVFSVTEAKRLRNAELNKVTEAKALGYTPPCESAFSSVIAEYLRAQKVELSDKSYERTSGIVNGPLKEFFGDMTLSAITRGDVRRYLTDRAAVVGPWSRIRELNTAKHLFDFAIDNELLQNNPAYKVKPPKQPAGRKRFLQAAEVRAVLEASPEWLRPIVGLAALTLMRRGELLAIRWMDIDLTNRRILLNTSKNGEGRFVYLPQLACKLIESLPRNKARVTDFVFPVSQEITPEAVSVAFARACKKANVHGCRFHDLRHTAATHLRLEGSDSHCVAQLAGQKSMKVAQGYQHLTPAYLSSQMSGLDHAFRELNDLPLLLNGQQAEASGHDGVTIEQQNATESVQTTVS